jgi:ligand-binding sensor domain-containing protein
VMSLCADSAGSVYIGTCRNGVVKFDGTTKTTYDLTKLINHSNVVSALAYDSQRNILWIGTQWQGSSGLQSGVVKFDGTNWTEYNWSTSPLPEAEISSLATDGNGGVWITTWYDGVAHFDGGSKWDVYHPTNSPLPSDRAWKVDRAQNGDIWVATETGAAKWDGLKWTPFTTANSGIIDNLATVGVDSKGDIWFGSFNGTGVGGACEFDGTKWTPFTTTTSPIGSNLLENIIGGRNGDVWFETYDGVLRSIVATVDSIPKSLGLTTITLTVNYDEQMLTLRKVVGLNGWTLRKSTPLPNGLSLMLTTSAHDSPAGEQIAAVEFIAFIGRVSKSDLRLSDTHFNPADSNYERCTLASFTADSLQVALENACGNTTLQTFLNKQPLIDILSVSPNPVSVSGSTSMISLNLFLSQDIHATISITDLTGKSAFESSSDMKAGESVIQLSVSGLSEGAYLVTVANGATQVSRKIMVQSK